METTLHRQLKALYCDETAQQEVRLEGFRIDAVNDGRLVEIQYGSLAAIRAKVQQLVKQHDVLVVKPLAARKHLVTRRRKRGPIVRARYSPSRATGYDLFEDLVHFVDVFPHPRLTLEVLLTEQEEQRVVCRKRRWHSKGYRVEDRVLRCVHSRLRFRTAEDLLMLLPDGLPEPFSTEDLSRRADIPRWLAQKMAYCLRKTGAADVVAKRSNALLYRSPPRQRAAA